MGLPDCNPAHKTHIQIKPEYLSSVFAYAAKVVFSVTKWQC